MIFPYLVIVKKILDTEKMFYLYNMYFNQKQFDLYAYIFFS